MWTFSFLLGLLTFLNLQIYVSCQLGKFSAIISFTIFSSVSFPSPSHIYITWFLDFFCYSLTCPKDIFFSYFTLCFLCSDYVTSVALSLSLHAFFSLLSAIMTIHWRFLLCYCIFSVLKFPFDTSLFLPFLISFFTSKHFSFFADNFYFLFVASRLVIVC